MVVKKKHLKPNHAKGWCGQGRVRSLCDFDNLDAHGSQFLRPWASPASDEHTSKRKSSSRGNKKANFMPLVVSCLLGCGYFDQAKTYMLLNYVVRNAHHPLEANARCISRFGNVA